MRSLTRTLLAITVFQLTVSTKCKSIISPYRYHFLQPVDVHPYQKTYNVGDTITFGFTDTAKMLFDTISNTFIKADSFTYTFRAGFERLDNYQKPIPISGYFLVSNNGGAFANNTADASYGLTLVYTNLGCDTEADLHYSVRVIPKLPGIYALNFLQLKPPSYCSGATGPHMDINYLFNVQDCNGDLLAGVDPPGPGVDTANYAQLALIKKQFIFKIE